MDAVGKWLVFNKDLVEINSLINSDTKELNGVYEVLRVYNSTPLFLAEHYRRLIASILALNINCTISLLSLKSLLNDLISNNSISEGNIRIEVIAKKNKSTLYIYQIKHNYPDNGLYKSGIKLKTYSIERPNPQIKQTTVKKQVSNQIKALLDDPEIFEVLLINQLNNVTEGSKSNILFVSEDTLYSSPSEDILEGITRKIILSIAPDFGFKIVEKAIPVNSIRDFEGCFITGTSPKLLPVNQIDSITYNPTHTGISKLIIGYDMAIKNYCRIY